MKQKKKQKDKFLKRKNSLLGISFLFLFTSVFAQSENILNTAKDEIRKEALYNYCKNENQLDIYKRMYRNNTSYSFYTKFIYEEENYKLYAYCLPSSHATFSYFIIETVADNKKYYFIRGYYIDDLLKNIEKHVRKLGLTRIIKVNLMYNFIEFYNEFEKYK